MADKNTTTAETASNKGRKRAPENETKAERFKRIGNIRIDNALDTIRLVGNLASPDSYEYTPEQAAIVVGHLETAVEEVKTSFANPNRKVTSAPLL